MHGLPGKLSLLLLVLASLLLSILGLLEYQARRARLDAELQRTLNVVANRLETSLSRAVYEFSSATQKIVEAEFPDPSIHAILVWSEGQSWPLVGLERNGTQLREIFGPPRNHQLLSLRRELAISYVTSAGTGHLPVGSVEIYVDPTTRRATMLRELLFGQLKLAVTVMLLLLTLFFVVYRYLVLPLEGIRSKMVRLGSAPGTEGHSERMRLLNELPDTVSLRGFREISEMDASFRQMVQAIDRHDRELRASEEKFHAVFDQTYELLGLLDPQGRLLEANSTALALINNDSTELVGMSFWETPWWRGLPDEQQNIRDAVRRAAAGETCHFETRHFDRNNTLRYIDFTLKPIYSESGELIYLVPEGRDITERKQMEGLLVQSEKMLSVGGLAAGVAHEINNPLAGILQNTQVLRNRLLGDLPANRETAAACGADFEALRAYLRQREVPRMLDSVSESAERAASIVKNMLNFSRKSLSCPVSSQLPELLDQALELAASDYDLKKKYDFRHIAILRDYEAGLPGVECEPTEIQQVFLNILKNGAQAMAEKLYPEGDGPTFHLRITSAGSQVLVEIADNGPGMPDGVRTRIFEPFFTTKEVGTGTGLGLSVCYFIVAEHHGGTLEVFSDAEKGTRFVISLPCQAAGHTPMTGDKGN